MRVKKWVDRGYATLPGVVPEGPEAPGGAYPGSRFGSLIGLGNAACATLVRFGERHVAGSPHVRHLLQQPSDAFDSSSTSFGQLKGEHCLRLALRTVIAPTTTSITITPYRGEW